MKSPDLSKLITSFFLTHLAAERNVSHNTVNAYRGAWKLFLRFAADVHQRKIDALTIDDLSADVVLSFLDSLETSRKNSIHTRNARLAAIHCFFRYVLECEPSLAMFCQRILMIHVKKTVRPMLGYLTAEELDNLLRQVDRTARQGPRDYLLLTLLYDTGNGIAPTLRAGSDSAHGSYTAPRPIHPFLPRCITTREAARLHGFPDWFAFYPLKWHG